MRRMYLQILGSVLEKQNDEAVSEIFKLKDKARETWL